MGVIHRDIKPANLLLDGRGEVWITDFGLAQFQNTAGLTVSGELVGTLRYVSPEQAMARRGVSRSSHRYLFARRTLYELLTLQPVFDGEDRHALLHQIASDEPRLLRSVDPTIPFELETIVLTPLAKNPSERDGTPRNSRTTSSDSSTTSRSWRNGQARRSVAASGCADILRLWSPPCCYWCAA